MTLDQLRTLCDAADAELGPDKGRLVFSTVRMRKLLAVAEAAKDVIAFTKEPWDKDVDRGDATMALEEAFAVLEAAP